MLMVARRDFRLCLFRSILVKVELTSPAVCALATGARLKPDVAVTRAATRTGKMNFLIIAPYLKLKGLLAPFLSP